MQHVKHCFAFLVKMLSFFIIFLPSSKTLPTFLLLASYKIITYLCD